MHIQKVALALLLFMVAIAPAYAREGIGVTDYELTTTLQVGETVTYPEVARVFNRGDSTITLISVWKPNYNDSGLIVEVAPNVTRLEVDKSKPISLIVTAVTANNYSGIIEFTYSTEHLENYTGGRTTLGGSARASFIITQSEDNNPPPEKSQFLPPLTLQIIAIGSGVATLILVIAFFFIKGRRENHLLQQKTKQPLTRLKRQKSKESIVLGRGGEMRLIGESACPKCGAPLKHGRCEYCGYKKT